MCGKPPSAPVPPSGSRRRHPLRSVVPTNFVAVTPFAHDHRQEARMPLMPSPNQFPGGCWGCCCGRDVGGGRRHRRRCRCRPSPVQDEWHRRRRQQELSPRSSTPAWKRTRPSLGALAGPRATWWKVGSSRSAPTVEARKHDNNVAFLLHFTVRSINRTPRHTLLCLLSVFMSTGTVIMDECPF